MSKIQEDLRKWFKEKWVRFDTEGNIKGECARGEGEGKPKCLPMAKAQALGKEARASAAKRKRREDPKPHRKGKAKFVSTESFDPEELEKARKMLTGEQGKGNVGGNLTAKDFIKIHNAMHKIKPANTNTKGPFNPDVKEEYLEEKNKPTNPKLWSQAISMVKKKFKIYPSAYANAAAAKWYKSKGGGWKTMKEERQSTMKTTKDLFLEQLDIAQYGHIVEKDDGEIPEREITSRTAPLNKRIENALKTAREKTPEVNDIEITSKGNPKDFNTRQDHPEHKGDLVGRVKSWFRKRDPESQRFENGKSIGQGAPFHDYGGAADVAINPKNPRKSDYAAAKFASTAQSELIKQAKKKDEGPVIGFAVKPGEKSTPKSLSSQGYMNQPKGTPPGVQSIHIGYDNPGQRGTVHRDIRDKYAKPSNVYGPNRMVDPHSGTFALYQQQRTDAELGNLFKNPSATAPASDKLLPPLPSRKPESDSTSVRTSRPAASDRKTRARTETIKAQARAVARNTLARRTDMPGWAKKAFNPDGN